MSETTKEGAEMEAGRELDAVIAERVMGCGPIERNYPCGYRPDGCEMEAPDSPEEVGPWDTERHPIYRVHHKNGWNQPVVVPFYSTNIADAWEVVERMRALGIHINVGPCAGWHGWAAEANSVRHHRTYVHRHESAETAPLAVCLAALAALDAA